MRIFQTTGVEGIIENVNIQKRLLAPMQPHKYGFFPPHDFLSPLQLHKMDGPRLEN